MEKLDDDQLKDQVLYSIFGYIMLEFYEVKDLQASSWIELPEKESVGYKFSNCYQLCFMGYLSSSFFSVEDQRNRISNCYIHMHVLNVGDFNFLVKFKEITKFEELNKLKITVFELNKKC